jgi:RNA polymerase sigma-70 factor (ECF subfamily)
MPDDVPEIEPVGDDDLVVRAKTDRDAFGELFDRYYPRVLRYCLRRLTDRSGAEEVTSDVFLQVASHIGGFAGRTESDFRAWLFRIATNCVNAYLRQAQRRQSLWKAAAASGRIAMKSDTSPSTACPDASDWPTLCAAIGELAERDREIVALRFFAGCSHQEIAGVLGTSPGAVRTALSRALASLRERLDPPSGDKCVK